MQNSITFKDFTLSPNLLQEMRESLYLSTENGFYIIRGFLSNSNAQHLRKIWTNVPKGTFPPFPGKHTVYLGGSNGVNITGKNVTYWNYPWNLPYDEVSAACSLYIHQILSVLEERSVTDFIYSENVTLAFRVIHTKDKEGEYEIEPHTDFYDPDNKLGRNSLGFPLHNRAKLMATLFLSEPHEYCQGGFKFRTNFGKDIVIGSGLEVLPGDLLIWRHSNLHSVVPPSPNNNELGFLRLLFTYEGYLRKKEFSLGESFLLGLATVKELIPKPVKIILKKILLRDRKI